MRYYRVREKWGEEHVAVEGEGGRLTSLTSINEEVTDFRDLLKVSYVSGLTVDQIATRILSTGEGATFDLEALVGWSRSGGGDARLVRPLDPDEVLAGGVGNYAMPAEAVQGLPDAARVAYERDRPPVLYKGSTSRLAGPFDKIGVRADTARTVAEGELVLVVYKGKLVAYSTGNEVAGGLMGETMWWALPGKVFKGCASLGPCIVTPESLPDPTNLKMELVLTRNGREEARVENVTALRRGPEEIVRWTVAHDSPPDLTIIYSGGCVAAGQTPMEPGDVVRISLEGVGFVENAVEQV